MPTLRLAEYLREDLVFPDLPTGSKSEFLERLSASVAAAVEELAGDDLAAHLAAREEQQSTGIGGGLALPHAMVPGLRQTLVAVARVPGGIEFAALDGEPADLFFLLLSPPEAAHEHLRILARLARILDFDSTLTRLRAAEGAAELIRLLLDEDARHVY